MKKFMPVLIFVVALLLTAAPAFAMEGHECEHAGTTVESLHHCVMRASEMGHITDAGVTKALLAKLNAEAGLTIDAEHAGHLVMHAEIVIAALGG